MGVSGRDLEEECEVCWVRIKGAERQQHVLQRVCILLFCPRRGTAERNRIDSPHRQVTFSSAGKHTERTAAAEFQKKGKVAFAIVQTAS